MIFCKIRFVNHRNIDIDNLEGWSSFILCFFNIHETYYIVMVFILLYKVYLFMWIYFYFIVMMFDDEYMRYISSFVSLYFGDFLLIFLLIFVVVYYYVLYNILSVEKNCEQNKKCFIKHVFKLWCIRFFGSQFFRVFVFGENCRRM